MQVTKQLVEMMRLTARAFEREADEELIEQARAFVESQIDGLDRKTQALVLTATKQLQQALSGFDKSDNKTEWLDYLSAGYAELFLGVAEEPIAPFESVYLGAEKTLYEKQYFEVTAFMKEYEFAKPADFNEPEDHIAIEWAFLYSMLSRSLKLRETDEAIKADELDAAATCFAQDHLGLWNERACDDFLKSDDSNGFYSAFASLAKAAMLEFMVISAPRSVD